MNSAQRKQKNRRNQSRLKWIDALKGLATILVILGHIADGYINADLFSQYSLALRTSYNFIYSFHMYLFFIISGFVFYNAYMGSFDQGKDRYCRQLFNIAWIYFIFSIVLWIFKHIFNSDVNSPVTLADLFMLPFRPISPYWYLWVLFFLYVIFIFFKIKCINLKNIFTLSFLLGILGSCFRFGYIEDICNIFYYSLPFCVGVIASYLHNKDFKENKVMIFLSGVISVVLFVCIIGFDLPLRSTPIISLLTGITISYFIFSLCKIIFIEFQYCILVRLMEWIGKYSLEIYVIHCFITAGSRVILPKFGIQNFYLSILISFIMSIIMPIAFAFITKKLHIYNFIFKPANLLHRKIPTNAAQ